MMFLVIGLLIVVEWWRSVLVVVKVTIIDGVMALNIDMKLMMSNIDLAY